MKMIFVLLMFMLAATLSWAGAPSLSGDWEGTCYPLPKRHSIIFDTHFSESNLRAVSRLYAESDSCTTLNLTLTILGDYLTGGPSGEGFEIKFSPKSIVIELQNSDVVNFYNTNQVCGFADWSINSPKEIFGKISQLLFVF